MRPLPVSRTEALKVWAKIGLLGFGGPAGQIALMHRELVEQRRWIGEARFLRALNYCMVLPGPEAQQLAVYIGWLLHRTWGGVVAGTLFVLPGMLVLGALSWLYVAFGKVPLVGGVFFGLKAAILALVVEALLRIGKRAVRARWQAVTAGAAFIAIFALQVPFPAIVAGAALVGLSVAKVRAVGAAGGESTVAGLPLSRERRDEEAVRDDAGYVIDREFAAGGAPHTRPSLPRALGIAAVCLALWFAPVFAASMWLGRDHVVAQQGWFFSQSAVVTFGGAYAVLAYVAQRAVEDFGWLRPGEMIDGLALAETTPGPLILVLQFVGFVAAHRFPGALDPWAAAVLGALLTTWVTFVPSFLFIFVGAPWVEALQRHRGVQSALAGVTAAVVGVIANLALWFALHTVFAASRPWTWGPLRIDVPAWSGFDPAAAVLALAALVAVLRFKVALVPVLFGSALLGAGWVLLSR